MHADRQTRPSDSNWQQHIQELKEVSTNKASYGNGEMYAEYAIVIIVPVKAPMIDRDQCR